MWQQAHACVRVQCVGRARAAPQDSPDSPARSSTLAEERAITVQPGLKAPLTCCSTCTQEGAAAYQHGVESGGGHAGRPVRAAHLLRHSGPPCVCASPPPHTADRRTHALTDSTLTHLLRHPEPPDQPLQLAAALLQLRTGVRARQAVQPGQQPLEIAHAAVRLHVVVGKGWGRVLRRCAYLGECGLCGLCGHVCVSESMSGCMVDGGGGL